MKATQSQEQTTQITAESASTQAAVVSNQDNLADAELGSGTDDRDYGLAGDFAELILSALPVDVALELAVDHLESQGVRAWLGALTPADVGLEDLTPTALTELLCETVTIEQLHIRLNLLILLAAERLPAEEIAEARGLIEQLPEADQGDWYALLQSCVEYANQRDNEDPREDPGNGGTCNVTALAMCLEMLGVVNPDPSRQFEDVLASMAKGAITAASTWGKLAAEFGISMEIIDGWSNKPREGWERDINDAHLRKGHGVMMSLHGHLVRVQGMNDAGVIVDDPFGASVLLDELVVRNGKKKGYTHDKEDINAAEGDGEDARKGEDHGYPWADVEKAEIKYLCAFS